MQHWSRAILLAVFFFSTAEAQDVVLRIGQYTIDAELADTAEKRERGLMHRDHLAEGRGMIFVFPEPARYGLWMANTKIPLDAAFIDRRGVITQIVTMPPAETRIYSSPDDTMFALEANAGWFERRNITAGARVDGLQKLITGVSTQ